MEMTDRVVRKPMLAFHKQRGGHEFLGKITRQRSAWNSNRDIRAQMSHQVTPQMVRVRDIAKREQHETSALDCSQRDDHYAIVRNGNPPLIGQNSVHAL